MLKRVAIEVQECEYTDGSQKWHWETRVYGRFADKKSSGVENDYTTALTKSVSVATKGEVTNGI